MSTGAGWVSRLDLVVKRPDNQEQVLLTTQMSTCMLGTMILSGEALLTNMVEGTNRCFIRQIAHPGCHGAGATTNDHPIVYETSPGKRLNGLLNQDEVVENVDGLIVGEVVVPASLRLTVRKTRVQSGGPVDVNGELVIEECTGALRLGLSSSTGAGRVRLDRSELATLAVGGRREAELEGCTVAGDVHVTGEHLRASFTDSSVTATLHAEELVSVTWKRGRLPGWCFLRGVNQASFSDCELSLQAIERGGLTSTDCTLLALEGTDLDEASLERCHLAGGCKLGTGLTTGRNKRIQVTDCVWTGLDKSLQPLETCRVERSDFYGGGLEVIAARATCTLENIVFETTLRVRCPTALPVFLTIRANSFLGPVSVYLVDGQGKDLGTPPGFSLAGNYWGSARGPAGAAPDRPSGRLDGWGAGCSYPPATNYAATGRTTAPSLPQSIRPLPPVWVRGARMGQNVLGYVTGQLPPMRQGRDTLACYDLKTTAESLSGLRFWLVCGGDEARPFAPLDPAFEVRRDYGRPVAAPAAGNERRALNFIIHADRTRTPGLTVQLWMDNTGLTGYREAGRVQRLGQNTSLALDAPPGRPLVVGVIGTQTSVGGHKPAPDPGANSKVATHLQEAIPALWPLTTNDFRIVGVRLPPGPREPLVPGDYGPDQVAHPQHVHGLPRHLRRL
jgi:hypothetical protein